MLPVVGAPKPLWPKPGAEDFVGIPPNMLVEAVLYYLYLIENAG